MRLVDADALKKDIFRRWKVEKTLNGVEMFMLMVVLIDNTPTTDAVPVFESWLREIAINNADANKTVTFLEAVEDICNRAETGLRQYLEDCL